MDLSVTLGRLTLKNPVLVASGTFGYAREMAGVVDFAKLGGVIPKTETRQPRAGNDPPPIAEAAAEAGADAVSLVNTFVGLAIDWRRQRPVLGNATGGLSGPAIKPLALRAVWQVARRVRVPVVGIGGIATLDDVMEFLVAGASAVQLGTVNFYDPTASMRILDGLSGALASLGAGSVREVVGTLGTE